MVTGMPVLRTSSASSSLAPAAIDAAAGVDHRPLGARIIAAAGAISSAVARLAVEAIAGQFIGAS